MATDSGSSGKKVMNRVDWLARLWWARYVALLLVVLLLMVKCLHGQDAGQNQDQPQTTVAGPSSGPEVGPNANGNSDAGANAPRLARLSDVEGAVEVMSADNTQFPQVVQNMPLLEGMRVATPTDARAEIEFEDGSVVRLAPNSSLTLDKLSRNGDGDATQISIATGLVYLELRAAAGYGYQIGYGDGMFTPVQNSTVRVNMDSQPAELAVLSGAVTVVRADGTKIQVAEGESLKGDAQDAGRYVLDQTIAADSWDQWNQDRDEDDAQAAANQTTARNDFAGDNGYGWSDLDEYGSWYPVPGQGLMWQPAGYTSSFDPYGSGYWMNYPGYGYEWVSGYAWGWTPFHCGNWNFVEGFGWGWVPVGGCRGYRYGFGRGFIGARTNIVLGPSGYRYPVRPGAALHGHVVTVGAAEHNDAVRSAAGQRSVVYRGEAISALAPAAAGAKVNGARRDYPVNTTTHAPVVGKVPAASTRPNYGGGTRPANSGGNTGQNQNRGGGYGGGAPHYPSPPPMRPGYSPSVRSGGRR